MRRETCAHCGGTMVQAHCPGYSEANCTWVRCDECCYISDLVGWSYLPPSGAHKEQQ